MTLVDFPFSVFPASSVWNEFEDEEGGTDFDVEFDLDYEELPDDEFEIFDDYDADSFCELDIPDSEFDLGKEDIDPEVVVDPDDIVSDD